MNSNINNNEDRLIQEFVNANKLNPKPNQWFTHRVINKLPRQQQATGRWIMTIITIVAVMACLLMLTTAPQHIYSLKENNFSTVLLCMYIAIMSSVILVVLQVIRLIKTYF